MSTQILIGDCREKLRELPAKSVDLVIADPPYEETSLSWDKSVDGWLAELPRVMKRSASLWCFGSFKFFMANQFSGWRVAQEVIWEKHNGSSAQADRFRRVHEIIVQFYPIGVPWGDVYRDPVFTNDATARTVRRKAQIRHWGDLGASSYKSEDGGPRLMRSVFHARSCHGEAIHPTQKPVAVLQPLISYSCPPDGMVLDPFAGSGSTAIAAKTLSRDCIGIELNPEYAEMARERIRSDSPLFADVT